MGALFLFSRDGTFLTRERARLWAAALLIGFAVALSFLALTAHGALDYQGRPLGTDFSSFYSAATLADYGRSPYDQGALHRTQQALFGADTTYYAFAYPPIFLLIVQPLAKLPYLAALLLWQGASLLLYLVGMFRLRNTFSSSRDGLYWALVAGFTATFVNLTHGQNGFLSAGLFALALSHLDKRPWVAGLYFGLLAFKPQLGILIPVALMAGGRWKSFASAAGTVAMLVLFSVEAYGMDAWRGFLEAASFSQHAILDRGAVGFEKMTSVFAWMRLWGLPAAIAYGAQLAASLTVACAVAWLWHSNARARVKYAGLCLGTLLVTPFALDYDLMIVAPAIALLAFEGLEEGFPPYQRALLAVLWLAPIASREIAAYAHVPLAVLATLIAFGLSIRIAADRSLRPGNLAAA